MNRSSFLSCLFHSQIHRIAFVSIIMLAWNIPAFCGEIHEAARAGSSAAIEARLESGKFSEAVCRGDSEKIKTMLKNHPWLVSFEAEGSLAPMQLAVKCGKKDVVELLLATNADVNAKAKISWPPLHLAVQKGRGDMAELLLSKGAKIDAEDYLGFTPLHWAAAQNHKDVAVLLLAHKAEVNARDKYGYTPLHWAAEWGYKDIVELLLEKGSEINARSNGNGKKPFGTMEFNDDYVVVELTRVKNRGFAPLHLAVQAGRKDVVELLLAKGAEINAKDKDGKTPLRYAAKDVAEFLRQHGGHK